MGDKTSNMPASIRADVAAMLRRRGYLPASSSGCPNQPSLVDQQQLARAVVACINDDGEGLQELLTMTWPHIHHEMHLAATALLLQLCGCRPGNGLNLQHGGTEHGRIYPN